MLLVVKFKRGPCPATVEHIQTWRDGQKTFAQTIKLIIYYHSTAWNIFKLKPVCMLFHSHGFENEIGYKISIQVFMQDSLMNKVRNRLQLAGCVSATSSWGKFSIVQQAQEENNSSDWKCFIWFQHVITNLLQCFIFTKWIIINVNEIQTILKKNVINKYSLYLARIPHTKNLANDRYHVSLK